MKYLNVFLLITIALISKAYSFQFSAIEEIQELKTTVFGSNLIETISMTFASGPKADAGRQVIAQLNELKQQLLSDQAKDDKIFKTKSDAFNKHIAALAREIKILDAEILRLELEIQRLAKLIAIATKNIKSFEGRIKNLETLLREMAAANVEDNRYYNIKINDLGRLYNAFTGIIGKINKMKGSVSAVNKYSHIKATASELRDMAWKKSQAKKVAGKSKPTPAAKPVKKTKFVEVKEEEEFNSFLQIENTESAKLQVKLAEKYTEFLETTVNADQGALTKLVQILSRIQDEQLAKKNAAIAHLANINKTYKKIKAQTEKEIVQNKIALKKQTENRAKYMDLKKKAEILKAQKEARRLLLINEKKINEQLLANLNVTYAREKAARAQETNVVDILQRIVEKRLLK